MSRRRVYDQGTEDNHRWQGKRRRLDNDICELQDQVNTIRRLVNEELGGSYEEDYNTANHHRVREESVSRNHEPESTDRRQARGESRRRSRDPDDTNQHREIRRRSHSTHEGRSREELERGSCRTGSTNHISRDPHDTNQHRVREERRRSQSTQQRRSGEELERGSCETGSTNHSSRDPHDTNKHRVREERRRSKSTQQRRSGEELERSSCETGSTNQIFVRGESERRSRDPDDTNQHRVRGEFRRRSHSTHQRREERDSCERDNTNQIVLFRGESKRRSRDPDNTNQHRVREELRRRSRHRKNHGRNQRRARKRLGLGNRETDSTNRIPVREESWRNHDQHGRREFQMPSDDIRNLPGQSTSAEFTPCASRYNQSEFLNKKKQKPPFDFKYKRLERMTKDDDESVLYELAGAETSLEITLNQSEIRRDLMTLLLRVLAKACHAKDAPQNTINVLSVVKTSSFLKEHLLQHISKMKTDDVLSKKDTLERSFRDCIALFKTLLKTLPSTRDQVGVLLDLMTNACNTVSKQGQVIDQKLIDDIEELQKYQATCVVQTTEGEKQRLARQGYSSVVEPPNDFHEFSIFPTLEELTTTQKPYLRQNIVNGKYRDLQHYLDIQFRLMREDFVAPLRKGIAQFQTGRSGLKEVKDIRVYERVRFLYPVCTNFGVVYRVQFDTSLMRKIRWGVSKRLLHGSLICMSKDNFATALFGTVANRDPKQLSQGILDIDFKEEVRHFLNASHNFTMVESVAFFEAYRHVLEGLKEITEESLPFKSQIIKVSPQVNRPQYLDQDARFDLSTLLQDSCTETDATFVPLLDRQSWPPPGHIQLDQSQLLAVYTALTSAFSVIQGPPGTGKTHVGLKIIQVLLNNKLHWKSLELEDDGELGVDLDLHEDDFVGPILVVCYTNHALDQFLEGVISFNSNIVRVGGRGRSEKLVSYNLNRLRDEIRGENLTKDKSLRQARYRHRKISGAIRAEVEEKIERLQATFHGLVSPALLEKYMTPAQRSGFVDYENEISEDLLLQWFHLKNDFKRYTGYDSNDRHGYDLIRDNVEEGELISDDEYFEIEDRIISEDEPRWYPKVPSNIGRLLAFDLKQFRRKNLSDDPQKRKLINSVCKRIHDLIDTTDDRMSAIRANRVDQDIWRLSLEDRWKLYQYWVFCFRQEILQRVIEMLDNYKVVIKALREVMDQEEYHILRHADVIGMTTTKAAKCRALLQRVKPKIIIIEEAAEILESHIITTLSASCKQLILIGDHQQLRPNPTVYRLAKDFNLDISLFERMVKNDVPCQKLTLQHRMRPDISHIVKKHFYNNLQDHESVCDRENVRGVCSNVFFIDHTNQESSDEDTRSRSNMHEASFMVAFCNYLLQQGYSPTSITVLTTYTGQLLNFKQLMKNEQVFSGVRVCVVDNYQGEENDIILLSLVRSNVDGSIGFLKVSNRVCVALSRAKIGLFCIGNFEQLSRQSEHWKKITMSLKSKNQLGSTLTLACEMHPDVKTSVSTEKDFKAVPEGGCKKPCEVRLDCGHVCDKVCHPYDREHLQNRCMKQCTRKICENDHKCRSLCYQQCPNVCEIKVEKELPRCGHRMRIACFSDPALVDCEHKCDKTLSCGHPCKGRCKDLCSRCICNVKVKRDLPCGHSASIPCSDPSSACPIPCTELLECGHKCTGTCGICLQGRLHKACTKRCGRILVCGHECKGFCTESCPPCTQKCENRCSHSRCPRLCGDPCVPCREPCEWKCEHAKCSKTCGEPCDRQVCNQPCKKKHPKLADRQTGERTRHRCIGVCGEPCPDVCKICAPEKVTEIFFGTEEDHDAKFIQLEGCKHVLEMSGMDQWMNMADESQTSESVDIQMKACPKCKAPIRHSMRYRNIIKKILGDIEAVKARVRGNAQEIKKHEDEVRNWYSIYAFVNSDAQISMDVQWRLRTQFKSLHYIVTLRNEISLYKQARKLIRNIDGQDEESKQIKEQLRRVRGRLFNNKLPMSGSSQEIKEFTLELERIDLWIQLNKVKQSMETLEETKKTKTQTLLEQLTFLTDGKPLSEKKSEIAKDVLKQIREICTGLCISESERQMIVNAFDWKQWNSKGHWFKCPNGHIYVITECGGATEEKTCPECKCTIGGQRHAVRNDNTLAPEMDGARHAAWSDQANMDNYDLRDIL